MRQTIDCNKSNMGSLLDSVKSMVIYKYFTSFFVYYRVLLKMKSKGNLYDIPPDG